jgi:energy-coupling factor transport system ATP-binding protein
MNLTLYRGQKIALVGSNGAGKTTLMKQMIGLIKPAQGDARVFGRSVRDCKPENLSKWISLVYQNPEQMFIKDSIRSDIAYAMQVRGVPEYEARTAELLDRFHLTELQERDGRLLSGGQMRRASLAIGIALNPGCCCWMNPRRISTSLPAGKSFKCSAT